MSSEFQLDDSATLSEKRETVTKPIDGILFAEEIAFGKGYDDVIDRIKDLLTSNYPFTEEQRSQLTSLIDQLNDEKFERLKEIGAKKKEIEQRGGTFVFPKDEETMIEAANKYISALLSQ